MDVTRDGLRETRRQSVLFTIAGVVGIVFAEASVFFAILSLCCFMQSLRLEQRYNTNLRDLINQAIGTMCESTDKVAPAILDRYTRRARRLVDSVLGWRTVSGCWRLVLLVLVALPIGAGGEVMILLTTLPLITAEFLLLMAAIRAPAQLARMVSGESAIVEV